MSFAHLGNLDRWCWQDRADLSTRTSASLLEGSHTMAKHLAHRTTRKERRTKPRLEALEERSLLAAAIPGVTLDPLLVPKFVNPLTPTPT